MDNTIIGGTVSTTFPVPTKLSDLKDDTTEGNPINFAQMALAASSAENATMSEKAACDHMGNVIRDTYAQKTEVVKDLGVISSRELDKITDPGLYTYGDTLNAYYVLSVYADLENGIYRQRKFDLEGAMIREGELTQPGIIKWSDWVDNGSFGDIPTNLSDLKDDLNIQENIDNKLERGWKEIGSEVITQADADKCTEEGYDGVQGKGVYCGDLTQYVELMCVVRIHSDTTSLNTTTATWFVGLSADVDTPPDDYSERMNSGYFTGYQPKLQPNKQNEIIVRSYFMDGSHLFSEHIGSDTGGFGGLVSGNIARIFEGANGRSYFPTKLEGKTTYWFASFISPSLNTKFVLPVGTTIKVYGR